MKNIENNEQSIDGRLNRQFHRHQQSSITMFDRIFVVFVNTIFDEAICSYGTFIVCLSVFLKSPTNVHMVYRVTNFDFIRIDKFTEISFILLNQP